MRLWSIHPKYLDSKRLTAQWREALLCRKVLEGKTKGYKHHPQFLRAKNHPQPFFFINYYLYTIWEESKKRGYNYDKSKLIENLNEKYQGPLMPMEVTSRQAEYEYYHIQNKIGEFNEQHTKNEEYLFNEGDFKLNPCFAKIEGDIMDFEKVKDETLKLFYDNHIMLKNI
ncbi:MAG: pyrimidine dimer DNA glycosylase/endonuclease V [Nanoarchaeota archaeon]